MVTCLDAHGVAIATGATAKDIRAAFAQLSPTRQLLLFAACGSLLPGKTKRKIEALMKSEASATTTTS